MALKTSTKVILGIVGSILILSFGIAAYGVWKIYSVFNDFSSYTNRPLPPELAEPRVLTGDGFLSKKEILKKQTKSLADIVVSGSSKDEDERERLISIETAKSVFGFSDVAVCGNDVVAAGKFGAYVTNIDSKGGRFIAFEPLVEEIKVLFWTKKNFRETADNLRIIDIEGDGKCEFHSNSPSDGLALFDSNGKASWRYRNLTTSEYLRRDPNAKHVWVTSVHAVDVNVDGRKELLLILNEEGVRAFSAEQKELWYRAGDVRSYEMRLIDIDFDGKEELLNFIGGGSELMDPSTGKFIKDFPLPGAVDGVMTIEMADGKLTYRLAGFSERKFKVYDLSGKEVIVADAPLSSVKLLEPKRIESYTYDTEEIYQPLVLAVSLKPGQEKFYVVLGSYVGIPRSQVYVYDSKGKLVYHEVLGEQAEAMTVLTEKEGREGFIVAGKDTIWLYSVN